MEFTKDTRNVVGLIVIIGFMLIVGNVYDDQRDRKAAQAIAEQQVLLDSKIHLLELKVNVINEQDTEALVTDYNQVMHILRESHSITGEGLLARDKALQAVAASLGEAIRAGSVDVLVHIEAFIAEIERLLHVR
jgi:hypothetical protein